MGRASDHAHALHDAIAFANREISVTPARGRTPPRSGPEAAPAETCRGQSGRPDTETREIPRAVGNATTHTHARDADADGARLPTVES